MEYIVILTVAVLVTLLIAVCIARLIETGRRGPIYLIYDRAEAQAYFVRFRTLTHGIAYVSEHFPDRRLVVANPTARLLEIDL